MSLTIKKNLAHPRNYGGKRSKDPKHIVIHYTGNDGDTDEGNAAFFAREKLERPRSAHYFVDEDSATLSVPENCIAWHCGADVYRHRECRNENSIGIEMCSDKTAGVYVLTEKTVSNTVELTKILMKKYGIPAENVLRHFDVTGKLCPEPFVRVTGAWEGFLKRLKEEEEMEKRYQTIAELPEWAQPVIKKLVEEGKIADGEKLDLTMDMVRTIVICKR